ncbi:MAG: PfkB family carbohydrate kinase [Candidatus Micrarchaeia archaeon]|jgi:sugar/nucleoside kinase (ribokinase family)
MITAVGSIGLDTTRTFDASVSEIPGGAVTFFSLAASLLAKVSAVSCVGTDFPKQFLEKLSKKGIDISGIEIKSGKTLRYHATYSPDFSDRKSDLTALNVFGDFEPELSESLRKKEVAYLGTASPKTQLSVIHQLEKPKLVAMDTIEYFIKNDKPGVMRVLSEVDGIIINESEARDLCAKANLIACGKDILKMGPSFCVIKKGEHGSILFSNDAGPHPFPGFPLEHVVDPTGAGDAFAGGFIGFLASGHGSKKGRDLLTAVAWGTVMGSITVEAFGAESLLKTNRQEAQERYDIYRNLMHYEE